ncbi:MAG: GNAT family N-acetyltransferase [Thaumarchaeota archaeon]|nr:GNAT family N-acetyltransferase [Nitrososphaerota archaeon]
MIKQIESNDNNFTGIWSTPNQLECGTLFLNPKLSDDVFFNKLTNVSCISEKMVSESLEKFQKNNSRPYVYSLDYPEFEELLGEKGFTYHDTQHVLKKSTSTSKKPLATKITHDGVSIWTEIFCEAYDCPEWAGPVNSILKNSLSSVDYYVDESHSSCMALYEKDSILGLYCLGTIPRRQRKGMAASLIDFALHEVNSRHLEFLMLETYEQDNLSKFYSNLGFENLYDKKIFTI